MGNFKQLGCGTGPVCHIVSCCLPNPGWDFQLINVSPNHGANITNHIATNVTMPTALSPPQQNSKDLLIFQPSKISITFTLHQELKS